MTIASAMDIPAFNVKVAIIYNSKPKQWALKDCPNPRNILRRVQEEILILARACAYGFQVVNVIVWNFIPQHEALTMLDIMKESLPQATSVIRGCHSNKHADCNCNETGNGASYMFGCTLNRFTQACKHDVNGHNDTFSVSNEKAEANLQQFVVSTAVKVEHVLAKLCPVAYMNMCNHETMCRLSGGCTKVACYAGCCIAWNIATHLHR